MKNRILFKMMAIILVITSCQRATNNHESTINLDNKQIEILTLEIENMLDRDQKYRGIISLGTLNDSLLKKDKELRKTASLEEYIAFKQSITKTLAKKQHDSLWHLQHQIDYDNYLAIKSIIKKYGYPSKELLGKDLDVFSILVHPPVEIASQKYLEEIVAVFKPEVLEKRMDGSIYAMIYDNIKAKILNEPQLYGTNNSFNSETMMMGNPIIKNIETTNIARKEIGLPELCKGEYELME